LNARQVAVVVDEQVGRGFGVAGGVHGCEHSRSTTGLLTSMNQVIGLVTDVCKVVVVDLLFSVSSWSL